MAGADAELVDPAESPYDAVLHEENRARVENALRQVPEPFRTTLVHCGAEYVFADLAPGRYQISLLPKDGGEALRREEVVVTDSNLQRNFGN